MTIESRVTDGGEASARRAPTWTRWTTLLAAAVTLQIGAAQVAAQGDDDPPARVGRIADFAGQLYLSAEDRPDDWSAVGINYPVTSGDSLWVSGEGRAEVDYGGGQFRIAGDTNLHVSRLDDRQITLFVAQGRLIVRVRVLDAGDAVRVDTPNTQVALTRPGLYRIDVVPDRQTTTVSVREGESLVGLVNGFQQALPGQTVTVAGAGPLAADIRSGVGSDGFDTWSASRERRYERGRATAFVSRQMVGYAELDENGTWETNPTYGPIWYPATVAADWAPYRDGYWTSIGAWGLTWVDSAPWGYAPSHYGRWVRVNARWAWCPGAYVARPYWAPALVGWYGGARWGVTANAGAPVYAWVPLGWGEAFHPWWRGCSTNCWSRFNQPYAVNVTVRPISPPERYMHAAVPGALTAVAGATLAERRPVTSNRISVPASQLASAPVLAAAPTVAPGPVRAPVVRPGERGTPVPASSLYAHAKRNPALATPLPAIPATGQVNATSPTLTNAATVTPAPAAPRMKPAPAPAAPASAQASGGSAASTAANASRDDKEPRPRNRPIAPAPASGSGTAPIEAKAHGNAGIALPPSAATAARSAPAPTAAQPAVTPARGAAVVAPVDHVHGQVAAKAAADAEALKGAKAGEHNSPGAPPPR